MITIKKFLQFLKGIPNEKDQNRSTIYKPYLRQPSCSLQLQKCSVSVWGFVLALDQITSKFSFSTF